MKNLITILLLSLGLISQAQITGIAKGQYKVITVGAYTYSLFWPDAPAGAHLRVHVAWSGNGEQSGNATKSQVSAKLFNATDSALGMPWNGKLVHNNPTKDTSWFLVLSMPNYGNTMSRYTPAIDSTLQFLLNQGLIDTSRHEDFSMSGLSGGPGRMWYWLTNYQSHNSPFRYLFKRTVSMSTVNTTSALMASQYSGNGAHWVWSDPNDPNGRQKDPVTGQWIPYSGYTDSSEAIKLHNNIHSSSIKRLTWDRNDPACHCNRIWDTAMRANGLQTFDGGTAETSRWRFLADPNDGFYTAANIAPTVDAGADQTTSLTSVTLTGTANDPDGTIASYLWTKVSGTGGTITSPTSASTTVTGLSVGTYIFQLKATDNSGDFATDPVTITITAANQPPTAKAGSDKNITLPTNNIALNGRTSTDVDGTIVSYAWTQISGPTVTLNQPLNDVCNVYNMPAGSYSFELIVTDDDGATAKDTVNATVNGNAFPVADAGPDMEIILPTDTIYLDGSNSTDQEGAIASYTWEIVSGPGAVIVSPDSVITKVINMEEGLHELKLTVVDSAGQSHSDNVEVLVSQEPVTIELIIRVKGRKAKIVNTEQTP